MNQVALDRSTGTAGRRSLMGRFPTAKFLIMSRANRFTVSLVAALGGTLSWTSPVFA
jgi:hypothetical protein